MRNRRADAYSYSRLYTALNRPQEFIDKYVWGIEPKPTEKMLLGKVCQQAACGEPWKEDLKKYNLRRYEFKIEKFVKALCYPEGTQYEQEYTATIPTGELILAYYDGRFLTGFAENKFGTFWDVKRALTDDQITLYSYLWFLNTGEIPEFVINSGESKTGKNRIFATYQVHDDQINMAKRTQSDFDRLEREFIQPGIKTIKELLGPFSVTI